MKQTLWFDWIRNQQGIVSFKTKNTIKIMNKTLGEVENYAIRTFYDLFDYIEKLKEGEDN